MSRKVLLTLTVGLLLACPVRAATVGIPGPPTIPASDPDGGYSVTWTASATGGVEYVLEEATTPGFAAGTVVYQGKAAKAKLKGRLAGNTYYYRVKATLAGQEESAWAVGGNGCAVPFRVQVNAARGGTVTPNGLVEVPVGTSQAVVITPQAGYRVTSVVVDGVERGEVVSVAVPDDLVPNPKNRHAIKVKFAINAYLVTASAGNGGSIKPAEPRTLRYGKIVKYTVTPEPGQKIASLLVNGVAQPGIPASGPFSFLLQVKEETTVAASFVPEDAPDNPLTRQLLSADIEFLPQSFSSRNQLRVSLQGVSGAVVFTDASAAPLKKQLLDGSPAIPLANRFTSAENVVLADGSLYWIEGGCLRRLTPQGETQLLATGRRGAGADVTADIVVDDHSVYWVDQAAYQPCSPPCNWEIQKIPLEGGAPLVLATADRRIDSLKGDAGNIYWEEGSFEPWTAGCACGSQIKAVAKAGGLATVLVDGSLNGTLPAPPPGHIAGSWLPTGGIAVAGAKIFFAAAGTSSYALKSIPISGGMISDLASVPSSAGFARNAVIDLTANGAGVFWLDNANGALYRMPVGGGALTILADGLNSPNALAASTTTAFWTEAGGYGGCCLMMGNGAVRQVSLTGGAVGTVADGLDNPQALAVDDTRLVWSEMWRIAEMPGGSAPAATLVSGISSDLARIAIAQSNVYILDGDLIKVVPLSGGTVEKFASARFGGIGDFSFADGDIAADDTAVYWTLRPVLGETVVQKRAFAGGSPVTISGGAAIPYPQDCYWRIALDDQYVYWSDGSTTHPVGCAVKKVPLNGGAVTTLIDQAYLADFTVDGVNLYFSELEGPIPSIQKLPVNGGALSTVAQNVVGVVLANTDGQLYWLSGDSLGTVPKAGGLINWLIPNDLVIDPLLVLEGLHVNDDGIFCSETQTGSIYWLY